MCDLTSTIKPPLFSYNIQSIWANYTNIRTAYWEKINLMPFLLITKLIPNVIDI